MSCFVGASSNVYSGDVQNALLNVFRRYKVVQYIYILALGDHATAKLQIEETSTFTIRLVDGSVRYSVWLRKNIACN